MTTVRCPHCGTENAPDHRFCGMCGRALDEPVREESGAEVPTRAQNSAGGEAGEREAHTPAPAYTGGLFNLGAPAERPSRNLDYLLEDDEPRSHKGLVIGILALMLVAGLGYLRWRNGSFAFLNLPKSGTKTATQTTEPAQAPASEDPSTTSAPANAPTANPEPNGNPAAAGSPPAAAPANPAGATSAPTEHAASDHPFSDQAPADHAPADHASGDQASGAQATADSRPAQTQAASPTEQPAGAVSAGKAPNLTVTPSAPAPAESAPAGPATTPAAKPKPSPKGLPPTRPEDSVAMGERYLYGRGVPQDCARGLRYVKPAADASNAKAMITMGALYATGHCLSRDLPTAYRFFALALRKDPENGPLKQNAQMVWAQMTEAERQQAIRMTQ
jgi:hypothetical protein